MTSTRMQRKLTRLVQHSSLLTAVAGGSTAVASWLAFAPPHQGGLAVGHEISSRNVSLNVVPIAALVFVMCVAGALAIHFVQRKQAFARISGMRLDRAADLLLPIYITMGLARAWLLLAPCMVGLIALMVTGNRLLAIIPLVCFAILAAMLPTHKRFAKFVETGIGA